MKRISNNSCKTTKERYSREIGKTKSWYGVSDKSMSSFRLKNGKRLTLRRWSEYSTAIPNKSSSSRIWNNISRAFIASSHRISNH